METRITKIEKGEFYIEYRTDSKSSWKTFEKKFSTRTKAEEWLLTHELA